MTLWLVLQQTLLPLLVTRRHENRRPTTHLHQQMDTPPKTIHKMWCWLIVFHLFLLSDLVLCITLTEVRVPKHTIRGHAVKLECHYDMEGEALYSVKWYKDGREFYRYVPRDDPPGTVFPQLGIAVDLANSTSEQVILDPLDLSSSGKYRCEVSAEAPSFQTVSDHGEMMVVVLPDQDPYITGGKPRYQVGDPVRVNCTSGRSKPAVHLTWYINGDPADPGLLKRYEPRITGIDRLETSILGLEFRVKPKHFKHGDMKLKCLATISTVYWKSNEESVEGEKLQKAPTLESRRAVSADSRADRVQAASSSTVATAIADHDRQVSATKLAIYVFILLASYRYTS